LISGIKELTELVDAHLRDEELWVVPLINENLTDDEWHAATERGASFLNWRNMRFGMVFVGLVLAVCAADERRRFLAGLPPPRRLIARLFGPRAVASYRARLMDGPRR
jgi:hypothetical protein